ncbi:MAG: hypothetical protein GY854_31410 [Deltaproteobacteria bacterium]|nr:hypothetical protein [Deltaproteobacteria bacterium]
MQLLKKLAGSLVFLFVATLLTLGAMVAYIFPASTYIAERSVSVTSSFYVLGGFMLLVLLSAMVQTGLVVRIIWGAAALSVSKQGEADDDVMEMRSMRVTGTKMAVVLFALIAMNTLIFDQVGNGVVVSDTRTYRILTLLRSKDGQNRADAVNDAIMLTGEKRISEALRTVITTPGEAREWAAYAAGMRHDDDLADSILGLLETGTPRERSQAAMALARLKDDRLIQAAPEASPHMGELKGDLFKALGMLGKRNGTSKEDLETVGTFLARELTTGALNKEIKRLVIWSLGRFDAPEGLLPIEQLLENAGDSATLCVGLEALGHIGSASTSPKLIESIYKVDRETTCPEIVYADFTGHEVLLCSSVNLVERLVREVARIGDRRARPAMEKLTNDESFSKTIRHLAGEIAFQMKYKSVSPPRR